MDIGLVIGAAGLIVAVVGIVVGAVVAYRIAKRQEKLERSFAKKQEEQERTRQILDLTKELSSHLTSWRADLVHAYPGGLTSFGDFKIDANRRELEKLMIGYQNILKRILEDLQRFPECQELRQKVSNFEKTVLAFMKPTRKGKEAMDDVLENIRISKSASDALDEPFDDAMEEIRKVRGAFNA